MICGSNSNRMIIFVIMILITMIIMITIINTSTAMLIQAKQKERNRLEVLCRGSISKYWRESLVSAMDSHGNSSSCFLKLMRTTRVLSRCRLCHKLRMIDDISCWWWSLWWEYRNSMPAGRKDSQLRSSPVVLKFQTWDLINVGHQISTYSRGAPIWFTIPKAGVLTWRKWSLFGGGLWMVCMSLGLSPMIPGFSCEWNKQMVVGNIA